MGRGPGGAWLYGCSDGQGLKRPVDDWHDENIVAVEGIPPRNGRRRSASWRCSRWVAGPRV